MAVSAEQPAKAEGAMEEREAGRERVERAEQPAMIKTRALNRQNT
jgi:hypothetical protein